MFKLIFCRCRIECWSFEFGALFAAGLSASSLSAQTIVTQTVWFLSLILMSVGDAGNVLIGQHLGANKPKEAINTKNVLYTLTTIVIVINMIFVVLIHHWLPYVFNIPPSTLSIARNVLLVAAIYSIVSGLNIVQISIVKAW